MWYEDLFERMEAMRDEKRARKMAAYMKNRFEFLGLPKPVLDSIRKPALREARKLPLDWECVFTCWEKPFREAQYVAVGYLLARQKELQESDLEKLKRLITEKSWWDTVDMLAGVCGTLAEKYPELKETMLAWSLSENIWLRRAAIDFQQKYKARTDTALLERIIVNNLGSDEFFINKAIGWSLREYAKTDPDWVRGFLDKYGNSLSSLSRREASKHLS